MRTILTSLSLAGSQRQADVKMEAIVMIPGVLVYVIEVKNPARWPSRCCRTSETIERQSPADGELDDSSSLNFFSVR